MPFSDATYAIDRDQIGRRQTRREPGHGRAGNAARHGVVDERLVKAAAHEPRSSRRCASHPLAIPVAQVPLNTFSPCLRTSGKFWADATTSTASKNKPLVISVPPAAPIRPAKRIPPKLIGKQCRRGTSENRPLPTGRCGDILPPIHRIRDRRSAMAGAGLKTPKLVAGARIQCKNIPFRIASEHQIARLMLQLHCLRSSTFVFHTSRPVF